MGFIRHQYGPFHTVVRALSERRMGFISKQAPYYPSGRPFLRHSDSPYHAGSALYFLLLNFRFSVYLSFMLSLSAAAFFCVAHGSEGLAHVVRTQSK